MNSLILSAYLGALAVTGNAKDFIKREVFRMKDDERGMELLQILLIVLLVVIIAAAVWIFLGDWIADLLDDIEEVDLSPGRLNERGQ